MLSIEKKGVIGRVLLIVGRFAIVDCRRDCDSFFVCCLDPDFGLWAVKYCTYNPGLVVTQHDFERDLIS